MTAYTFGSTIVLDTSISTDFSLDFSAIEDSFDFGTIEVTDPIDVSVDVVTGDGFASAGVSASVVSTNGYASASGSVSAFVGNDGSSFASAEVSVSDGTTSFDWDVFSF